MLLYHPSNKKFDIVKIKYFGENSYTFGDVKVSTIPRTFWYLTPNIPENRLSNTRYLYVAEIELYHLYDFRNKNFDLLRKFRTLDEFLIYIKKHYKGIIYNLGVYDMVAIFYDIKPIKIIKRK